MCGNCLADYKPPLMRNGTVFVYDWVPVRRAIEAAYKALGQEVPNRIPSEIWNMVAIGIEAHEHDQRPHCLECKTPLSNYQTIRCLDCKSALCEQCAPHHFWPNGNRQAVHRNAP